MRIKRGSLFAIPDYVFIGIVSALVIFGLVMLTSASSDLGKNRFDDVYYFLKSQLFPGLFMGVLGFFAGYFIDYRFWKKLAPYLLGFSVLLLLLVFVPGLSQESYGATRWLNIAGFSIQPGEIAKLGLLIFVSAWLSNKSMKGKGFFEGIAPMFLWVACVIAPIIFQPATTIAVILVLTCLVAYFVSGGSIWHLLLIALVGLLILGAIIASSEYRRDRLFSYLNPENDPLGSGYQLNQALIAIGSGGVFGVGFGESTTKLQYLPEPIGDSIFAVIAEELGFVGGIFVILLFVFFLFRGFSIGKK